MKGPFEELDEILITTFTFMLPEQMIRKNKGIKYSKHKMPTKRAMEYIENMVSEVDGFIAERHFVESDPADSLYTKLSKIYHPGLINSRTVHNSKEYKTHKKYIDKIEKLINAKMLYKDRNVKNEVFRIFRLKEPNLYCKELHTKKLDDFKGPMGGNICSPTNSILKMDLEKENAMGTEFTAFLGESAESGHLDFGKISQTVKVIGYHREARVRFPQEFVKSLLHRSLDNITKMQHIPLSSFIFLSLCRDPQHAKEYFSEDNVLSTLEALGEAVKGSELREEEIVIVQKTFEQLKDIINDEEGNTLLFSRTWAVLFNLLSESSKVHISLRNFSVDFIIYLSRSRVELKREYF
jgi:hypothetical protein